MPIHEGSPRAFPSRLKNGVEAVKSCEIAPLGPVTRGEAKKLMRGATVEPRARGESRPKGKMKVVETREAQGRTNITSKRKEKHREDRNWRRRHRARGELKLRAPLDAAKAARPGSSTGHAPAATWKAGWCWWWCGGRNLPRTLKLEFPRAAPIVNERGISWQKRQRINSVHIRKGVVSALSKEINSSFH